MKPQNDLPDHNEQQGKAADKREPEKNVEPPFPASMLELDALRAMLGLMQRTEPPPDDPEVPEA